MLYFQHDKVALDCRFGLRGFKSIVQQIADDTAAFLGKPLLQMRVVRFWKIQCKLPPKTKRFCPLVLK